MATVKQYTQQIRNRQTVIARKLGCDINQSDKKTRVVNLALIVLIAVLVKTLVDKGVITDADLAATLDAARDDAYDDEPIDPPAAS